MVLFSLIHQLPLESTVLEWTKQFWSLLSSGGMVPKVSGYFGIHWTHFLFEKELRTRLYPEIGSQRHGSIQQTFPYLVENFLG